MMRTVTLLLAAVFVAGLAAGCGGDSDKKGINKDRDKPVSQPPPKAAAPLG